MATLTTNIGLTVLAYAESPDAWGPLINANWDLLDALFDAASGHTHTGAGTNGPKLSHIAALTDIGTNTHAAIDTHIADGDVHFEVDDIKVSVSDSPVTLTYPDAGWNNGPNGEDIVTELRFANAQSITSPAPGVVVIDVGSTPTGGTGPTTGTLTHLPTTYAPVAITDQFCLANGRPLSAGNWHVRAASNVEMIHQDSAAVLYQDTLTDGVAFGQIIHRVRSAVPHSEVQRVALEVTRCAVDDFPSEETDTIAFQLALMASTFEGVNSICRLGFFLNIRLHKDSGGNIQMTRSLLAIPSVSLSDQSFGYVLWQDTGVVDADLRHYRGTHEFSLDRNHAFHYYWNGGPVDIGIAGDVGAATSLLSTLMQELLDEQNQYSQSGGPLPVAPEFGRFGFDVEWNVPNTDVADLVIRSFSASSTDDESRAYTLVKAGDDPGPPVATLNPADCCTAGIHADVQVGQILPVPALASSVVQADLHYQVVRRVYDNDPVYGYAGFLTKPVDAVSNSAVAPDVTYCSAMTTLTVEVIRQPRPGATGRIKVVGPRIPSLLEDPVFRPSTPGTALPANKPNGCGTHPQAIPYPVPSLPGVGVTGASYWADSLDVDSSVVAAVALSWDRGDLYIDITLADGLPYGMSLDLTLTDRLDNTNQVVIDNAVMVAPPNVVVEDVRLYVADGTGGFTRVTEFAAGDTVYAVVYGHGLPLAIDPTENGTDALAVWPGFVFDPTLVLGSYTIIEGSTPDPAALTIVSAEVHKGWYRDDLDDAFPPSGFTPATADGETLFLEIDVALDSVGTLYDLRISHPLDPSATAARVSLPQATDPVPVVTSFTVSPDTAADGATKTVVVTGLNFTAGDVDVASVSTGVSAIAVSSATATVVTFTCVTATSGDLLFTLTNDGGLGNSATIQWTAANGSTPAISGITPDPVTATSRAQTVNIAGSGFELGAVITTAPSVTIRSVSLDAGADTAVVVFDVPDSAGGTVTFTVTNPNANASVGYAIDIAAAAVVVSGLTYYASYDDEIASSVNTQGKEPGQTGVIRIAGTGFRTGATVIAGSPEFLILGAIRELTGTKIVIDYEIAATTAPGEVIDVTVQDLSAAAYDTETLTVEDHTPEITYVTVDNPREGAGDVAGPPYSAGVAINGNYLDEVATVTVPTGNGTPTGMTIVDAHTITLDNLAINTGTSGATLILRLTTTGGKIRNHPFTIQDHFVPKVVSWVVRPSPGGDPLVPIVVEQGAALHVIELYGTNLFVETATLTGPFAGPVASPTITQNKITFTLPTIDNPVTTSPVVTALLTPFGFSTPYEIRLFSIDTTVTADAVTVASITEYEPYEGSVTAMFQLTGTFLGPNRVGRVELNPQTPDALPLAVYPNTAVPPTKVVIVEQSATSILCRVQFADLLANQLFDVQLRDPTGAIIGGIGTHTVTVLPKASRPSIDTGALPTIDTSDGAAVDYVITLVDAEGGEFVEVINGTSVVDVATVSPSTIQVQFTNPAAGTQVEVRVMTYDGRPLGILRYETT